MEDSDELKKLLRQNLEISRESFKILKKLHRARKFALAFKILYWTAIILMVLGAYYYVQPFVDTFAKTFGEMKEDVSAIGEASKAIKDIPADALQKVKDTF